MSISSSTAGGGRTKYKIIFLGDQNVGKSSIIGKYIRNSFQEGVNPTVGIDFDIKNVTRKEKPYRIQVWDTAGQQRFRSLIPGYMKDANCAVLVYDISKKTSLQNLHIWNDMFDQIKDTDAIKVIVGNKIDLIDRQVNKKDAQNQAEKFHCKYFEVSAKEGRQIEELFDYIIDIISENLEKRVYLPSIEEKQQKKIVNKLKYQEQASNFKLGQQIPKNIKVQKKSCC